MAAKKRARKSYTPRKKSEIMDQRQGERRSVIRPSAPMYGIVLLLRVSYVVVTTTLVEMNKLIVALAQQQSCQ
jgi:hypothetical protein